MRNLYALFVTSALLLLAGCDQTIGQVANQGGNAVVNGGKSAGVAAGNAAQNAAIYYGKLVAAALVAVVGATFVRWLWRSAQIKYLLFAALIIWITYAVASHP